MRFLRLFLSYGLFLVCILGISIPAFTQDVQNMTAAEYKQWKETQRSSHHSIFAILDPLLSNDYVAVSVEETDARFTIGCTGGDPDNPNDDDEILLYGHPNPWSSFTTIRVNGDNHIYGGASGSFTTSPYNDASGTFNKCVWRTGDIEVSQILTLVNNPETSRPDIVEIRYTVFNNSPTDSHDIGIRIMLDTMLADNDGAPFRIPGVGSVTTERTFTGMDVPDFWQSFNNLTNPTVISQGILVGSLATAPDTFMLASWPDIFDPESGEPSGELWDYTTTPGKIFGTGGYPDSAVAVYWDPVTFGPNTAREYITYYGLSTLSTSVGELSLAVTGQASLVIEGDQYSTLNITAYVQNTNPSVVNNVTLVLAIPDGLMLVDGQNITQVIGSLDPGQEESIHWDVTAEPRSEDGTLTYNVTASGTGVPDTSVDRSVFVPAILTEYDVGFRPNPNGYQFENPRVPTLSLELFRDTYGAEETQINGRYRQSALRWYNQSFRYYAARGSCFGMAASSSLLYQHGLQTWDLGDDQSASLDPYRGWGIFEGYLNTVEDFVETYHGRQADVACQSVLSRTVTPNSTYQEIKAQMATGWNQDPHIICLKWSGGGGHAITPYRIEENADHTTARLYVYENESPYRWWWEIVPPFDQDRHYIEFDLENNRWSYAGDTQSGPTIHAVPLSAILAEPNMSDYAGITELGHLLFVDTQGRALGYRDGEWIDEMPEAARMELLSEANNGQFPETYYLPGDIQCTAYITGVDTGTVTADFFTQGSLIQLMDATIVASTQDQLDINVDRNMVTYLTNDMNKTYTMVVTKELENSSRVFTIANTSLSAGERATFEINPDQTEIKYFNLGGIRIYDLQLKEMGLQEGLFYHEGLSIGSNDTHIVQVDDWANLSASGIRLLIDEGSDGTVDEVGILQQQPVVSNIPDVSFVEDRSDRSIDLDDYVDDNAPDAEIIWTYSGNTHVIVAIDSNSHEVTFTAEADWNGSEDVTFTATDPGGLSDSDEMTVTVTPVPDVEQVVYDVLSTTLTLTFDMSIQPDKTCFDWIDMEIDNSGEKDFGLASVFGLQANKTAPDTPSEVIAIDLLFDVPAVMNLAIAGCLTYKDVDLVLGTGAFTAINGAKNQPLTGAKDVRVQIIAGEYAFGTVGDVSGDGKVTAYDAGLTLRVAAGESPASVFPIAEAANSINDLLATYGQSGDIMTAAADMSGDNRISAYDAALQLMKAVGLPINLAPALDGPPRKCRLNVDNYSDGILDVSISVDNISNIYSADVVMAHPALTVVDVSGASSSSGWLSAHRTAEVGKLKISMAGSSQPENGSFVTIRFDTNGQTLNDMLQQLRIAEIKLNDGMLKTSIENLPKAFALLQNYPNPFNPDTWIPYRLSQPANVTINIYNVTGQMVRRLELGSKMPGHYVDRSQAAYWDGKNKWGEKVSSGIYFYQLQADRDASVRKMIIAK